MIHPSYLKLTATLMALSLLISIQKVAWSQLTATQPPSDADTKVAAIMDNILKRGEGSVGDVKTSTWVPPSSDDIKQIRDIGNDAIAPLNKALDSRQRPFQQLLAVRLLGAIGGSDVVPPLQRALESDKANSVRMAALAALRSTPDSLAVPIIRSAVHDSDPAVAERAKTLLTDYYHLDISN